MRSFWFRTGTTKQGKKMPKLTFNSLAAGVIISVTGLVIYEKFVQGKF